MNPFSDFSFDQVLLESSHFCSASYEWMVCGKHGAHMDQMLQMDHATLLSPHSFHAWRFALLENHDHAVFFEISALDVVSMVLDHHSMARWFFVYLGPSLQGPFLEQHQVTNIKLPFNLISGVRELN